MRALFVAVVAMLSLAGCGHIANLGIDPDRLDTANKQLIAKAGEITALAKLGEELVVRGVVAPEQGLMAADYLQDALDLVNAAQAQIAETGDPIQAENALEKVGRSVDLALGLLTVFTPRTQPTLTQHRTHLYEHSHNRLAHAWQDY